MNNKFIMMLLITCMSLFTKVMAQNVGINNGTIADPNSILDISSTSKGLLIPRLDPSTITSPVNGLMIYNTITNTLNVNTGSSTTPTFYGFVNAAASSAVAPISYNGSAFTIPISTGSIGGYLAAADFTSFSAKQASLSGSGYPKFTGTTTPTYVTSIPNVDLTNSAITVQGNATSLGGSYPVINGTGFVKVSGTVLSYDNTSVFLTGTTGTLNSLAKFSSTPTTSLINASVYDDGSSRVGINTTAPNSTLHINGSFAAAVNPQTGAYTILATDYLILVNTTATNSIITLPDATSCTGRVYVIKDNSANGIISGGKNPSVDIISGTQKIDGVIYSGSGSPKYISLTARYQYIKVQSDGANWQIISRG